MFFCKGVLMFLLLPWVICLEGIYVIIIFISVDFSFGEYAVAFLTLWTSFDMVIMD